MVSVKKFEIFSQAEEIPDVILPQSPIKNALIGSQFLMINKRVQLLPR